MGTHCVPLPSRVLGYSAKGVASATVTTAMPVMYKGVHAHSACSPGVCGPAFSLGCFWGVLHPPIVQIYPPISVSEAAEPPYCPNIPPYQCFRGCCTPHKSHGMQSRLVFNNYFQIYTCKYTAINCTIVTLVEDRGWTQD